MFPYSCEHYLEICRNQDEEPMDRVEYSKFIESMKDED